MDGPESGAATNVGMLVASVLTHHGVKGMKWGVRKDKGHEGQRARTSKIARLDRKFARRGGSDRNVIRIYNGALKQTNAGIARINDKPQYKDADFTRDTPLRRKYYKEQHDNFINALEASANSMGTNASGTKKYGIIDNADGSWDVVLRDVQHAEGNNVVFTVRVVTNETGHIVSLELVDNAMAQADDLVADILEHHGIKGMKWGVHRTREQIDGGHGVTLKVAPGKSIKTSGGKHLPAHEDAIRAAVSRQRAKKSSVDTLSTKELQDLVQRMNLERQYSSLKNDRANPAVKFVAGLLGSAGKQQAGELAKQGGAKAVGAALKKVGKTTAKVAVVAA